MNFNLVLIKFPLTNFNKYVYSTLRGIYLTFLFINTYKTKAKLQITPLKKK